MNGLNTVANPKYLKCITFTACILSLLINCLFWASLGSNLWSKLLLTTGSCVFEAAKILGLSLAIWCFMAKHKKFMYASSMVYGVLFVVSILGSVVVLNTNITNNNAKAVAASEEYQGIERQILSKELSVAAMHKSATSDIDKGYRERANATIAKIEQSQRDLAGLYVTQKELANSKVVLPFIKQLPDWMLLVGIIVLGSLLECITGYLLAIAKWQHFGCQEQLLPVSSDAVAIDSEIAPQDCSPESLPDATRSDSSSGSNTEEQCNGLISFNKNSANDSVYKLPVAISRIATRSGSDTGAKIATATRSATVAVAKDEFHSRIDTVAKLVQTRSLLPTTRAVREHYKISNRQACKILKELAARKVITKKAKGYVCCNSS